jgi:cytochrome b subunit of formate dehydrogenase
MRRPRPFRASARTPAAGAGRLAISGALAVVASLTAPAPAFQAGTEPVVNRACLDCHGQTHLGTLRGADRLPLVTGPPPAAGEADAPRPGLVVTPDALAGTAHAELACVDCHRDAGALPHARELTPVSCNETCHETAARDFALSVHANALARGDPQAPRCQTCHGPHQILPRSDRRSSVHPLNAATICGDCHRQHTAPTTNGEDPRDVVAAYLDSVHGRGVSGSGLTMAATCSDCHGHHDSRAAGDPLARTSRAQIPRTCGACHLGVVETYAQSIHGQALAAGHPLAPVCTDCHTGHRITRATVPETHLDIVTECGDCHDREELSGDRRASFYRTYRASYHGQVTKLGSTRAARCSDCHGAHDILPMADPASRLHGENLVRTCRACHPKAGARFVEFAPHADYRDRNHYPVLYAVWMYFVIVMSMAFGFFGLHSLLWFLRSLVDRVRHGPRPRPAPSPHAVRRFTRLNRLNHGLVILTFFGLVITGIPLLFAERRWAEQLASALGGVAAAGIWHRTFAVLLMVNFTLHLYGMIRAARQYPGTWRQWLFGPNTMLPRLKDFRDCAGMFRWFFRGGRQPAFGRWTYWEKFDYWAEIIGSLIIGGSGVLLWFAESLSAFVPGWVFNVAMIVHGYEALLALGFIFTIHFFNAHLRLEKFPVDDVIFTGSLAEAELEHERPEEYEHLVESGMLEKLRVPAAPRWQRRVAIVVGLVAMIVGITLVTLIVLAGLGLLWDHA